MNAAYPAGIYLRLSDERQVIGEFHSMETHRSLCYRKAESEGYNVEQEYPDRGWSGRKRDRPEWRRMQNDIETGRIKAVIAYKLERTARNLLEGLEFVERLREYGCRLISVTEHVDIKTPQGRMNVAHLLAAAEYESNNIADKVSRKRRERAKMGLKNGGRYPPGFKKSQNPGVPVVDEVYGEIIIEVYQRLARGDPLSEIEKDLLARRIYTPKYEITRRGGGKGMIGGRPFRSDQLARLIRNPIYKGFIKEAHNISDEGICHTYCRGKFEALVSEELWAAANKALDRVKETDVVRLQQRDRWFHALKGLLFCDECQSAMTPHVSGKRGTNREPYRYYKCCGAAASRDACGSAVRHLPATLLEDVVFEYLGKMADDSSVTEAVVGASRNGRRTRIRRLGSQIRSLKEKHDSTKLEIANLTEVAAKLGVDGFTQNLRKRVALVSWEQNEILAKMHSLKREQAALKDERDYRTQVQHGLKNFVNVVRTLSGAEQRELVRLIVDAIVISPSKQRCSQSEERRLSMEIHLRMGALVKSKEQEGKKLKVNLDVTLHRSTSIWASTGGAIALEVRRPPKRAKPKRRVREHEMFRADQIQREMKRKGWSAAEFARRNGMSRAAVTHVLRWHRLSAEAQRLLRSLTDRRRLRLCSRRFREELLKLPKTSHLAALKKRLEIDVPASWRR